MTINCVTKAWIGGRTRKSVQKGFEKQWIVLLCLSTITRLQG